MKKPKIKNYLYFAFAIMSMMFAFHSVSYGAIKDLVNKEGELCSDDCYPGSNIDKNQPKSGLCGYTDSNLWKVVRYIPCKCYEHPYICGAVIITIGTVTYLLLPDGTMEVVGGAITNLFTGAHQGQDQGFGDGGDQGKFQPGEGGGSGMVGLDGVGAVGTVGTVGTIGGMLLDQSIDITTQKFSAGFTLHIHRESLGALELLRRNVRQGDTRGLLRSAWDVLQIVQEGSSTGIEITARGEEDVAGIHHAIRIAFILFAQTEFSIDIESLNRITDSERTLGDVDVDNLDLQLVPPLNGENTEKRKTIDELVEWFKRISGSKGSHNRSKSLGLGVNMNRD